MDEVTVQFKIEPNIIPATAIRRSQDVPNLTGGLCDIWKCHMSTQSQAEARLVAVKSFGIFARTDMQMLQKIGKSIRREAYVWMQLLHDNVLPLEGVTEGFGPLPAFVTPWMENGSLENCLRREVGLSWERKLSMVREIAAGLQHLHAKGIVHGDLTPTNVLVSGDGRLCLGDFGLSMLLAESGNLTFNSTHTGNVRWAAPELLAIPYVEEGSTTMNKPNKASDIYSYGCIMMQVFSGRQPYASLQQAFHVIAAVLGGRKPFSPLATSIGEEIRPFALQCLSTDMGCRPLVGEIVEFLWSQTNIAETMKAMVLQLPVTVPQISQAVITRCDYHPDDLDVLGAALKCKWVVYGSSGTELTGRGQDFEG
ncbi:kinase-like domain-containing protein [Suillus variegatus]|nr:kinase-like domain-containing protein [Suillus variegatus]